jgi:Tfp pilus assembly protein PilX
MTVNDSKQRGIALITAMMCLVLMSLIALFVSRSSTLDLRIASNNISREISFDNAEGARAAAEGMLLALGDENECPRRHIRLCHTG